METRKSLLAIRVILKTLILSGFLVFVLSNELQAEQESKSEKSYEQPYS